MTILLSLLFTRCDFDPVLSHYIPSQLLYSFRFVTLTLNFSALICLHRSRRLTYWDR